MAQTAAEAYAEAVKENQRYSNVLELDHTNFGRELQIYGHRGGELSLADYRRLIRLGHEEETLKTAALEAQRTGLTIGGQLQKYLDTGKIPDLPDAPGFEDKRGTADADAFQALTLKAEEEVVRDPDTGEAIGYTLAAGIRPNEGVVRNIYDETKTRIIGTLTGAAPGEDPIFTPISEDSTDDGVNADEGTGEGVSDGGGVVGGDDDAAGEDDGFDFAGFLNTFTQSTRESMAGFAAQMQRDREEADKRMAELTSSFQAQMRQQAANMRERPKVEGIKFATRGTGGMTQQQLRRGGVTGTFGRGGDRLMKISSLNI